MIHTESGFTVITCDKCGSWSKAPSAHYNEWFYDEGWVLNRGRKYEHLCRECLTPKQRKAFDFVKNRTT